MVLKDCLTDAEKRARVRSLTALNPWWNLKIVGLAIAWVAIGFGMLQTSHIALYIPGYLLIGAIMHSLAIFTHESTHGILFKNRFLNRWIGFLTGLPAFISVSAYGVVHAVHHKHTGDAHDPDEFTNAVKNPDLQRLAFFAWLFFGGPFYIFLHVPYMAFQLGRPHERRAVFFEYALMSVIYTVLIVWSIQRGFFHVVIHTWFVPALVAMVFVNVRGVAEHMMTPGADPFTSTRTVISNRMISFFMNNLNYHLEHHLIPNIPWYRLPALHALLREDMEEAGSLVDRSYLKVLRQGLKEGGRM